LGYAPRAANPVIGMDWAPVDYVARSIVKIAKDGPLHTVYHMSNPMTVYSMTMRRLVTYINSFGFVLSLLIGIFANKSNSFKVEQVSFNKWRRKLDKSIEHGTNALAPLRSYFDRGFPGDSLHSIDHTQEVLKGTFQDRCPIMNEAIVHTYLHYWIRRGVIQAPETAASAATEPKTEPTTEPK